MTNFLHGELANDEPVRDVWTQLQSMEGPSDEALERIDHAEQSGRSLITHRALPDICLEVIERPGTHYHVPKVVLGTGGTHIVAPDL